MRKRLEIWQNARKPRIRSLGDTQREEMLLSAVVSQLDKAAAIGIEKMTCGCVLGQTGNRPFTTFFSVKNKRSINERSDLRCLYLLVNEEDCSEGFVSLIMQSATKRPKSFIGC